MATSHVTPHQIVPLHLSGNTTELQNKQLREFLDDAVQEVCRTAILQLDQQSAQAVLDMKLKLKIEVAARLVEIIHRHTTSDKFKDEQVASDRIYPPTYRVRPIEAQVTELRKMFPGLGTCHEKLARRPLPAGAEAWFAIPRWQSVAPSYNQAVEQMLEVLAQKRKLSNRIVGKLGDKFLRESERAKLAKTILCEQQEGNDILVVGAQLGMLHRGASARRTRVSMGGNEYGLGVVGIGCILLTHPERLSTGGTLMIDCSGDEYSVHGDYSFDRVPLFDYDGGGIEVSIFYDDRARNQWGTPTGFLYRLV
jgi:hypothetical protein